MGKITSKLLGAMGFNSEDDDYGFEEMDSTEMYQEPPAFSSSNMSTKKNKVIDINATTRFNVVIIQPDDFNEAKEIADHLKERRPVVINLELLEKEVAHKVFDFLSGAVYALGGSIQRVSNHIYLIAPYNVNIMGDFRDELKNKGIL